MSRRGNWVVGIFNRDRDERVRVKEGPEARWAGKSPRAVGAFDECADDVVTANTQIYVQGGCDWLSGPESIVTNLMRAELGEPWTVTAEDFPLRLLVISANASLRGEDAFDAVDDETLRPALYASFYTEELDHVSRYMLWIGVPVGWLLFSCCSCCVFCLCCALCCRTPKEPRATRLGDHELADLAAQMPDLPDTIHGMPEEVGDLQPDGQLEEPASA